MDTGALQEAPLVGRASEWARARTLQSARGRRFRLSARDRRRRTRRRQVTPRQGLHGGTCDGRDHLSPGAASPTATASRSGRWPRSSARPPRSRTTTPPKRRSPRSRPSPRRPARDADSIVERVASVVGLSKAPFSVTELFWGGRRLLETLALQRPVVMVVDDIHVAESTFLEFLEPWYRPRVSRRSSSCAPLVTGWSSSSWTGASARDGPVVMLGPLSAADAGGLVDHLLGERGSTSRRAPRSSRPPTATRCSWNRWSPCSSTRISCDGSMGGGSRPPACPASRCRPRSRRCSRPGSMTCRAKNGRWSNRLRSSGSSFPARRVEEMVPQQVRTAVPGHLGTSRQAIRLPGRGRRGRRNLSLPPWPDPRRRPTQPAEAQSCPAPRAVRGLGRARQPRAGPGTGIRGDSRLPPRAGVPLSGGARAARRHGARRGHPRRNQARGGRSAGVRPWRPARGDQPAAARQCALPDRRSGGHRHADGAWRGPVRGGRIRGKCDGPRHGADCCGDDRRPSSPGARTPGADLSGPVFGVDGARRPRGRPVGSRGGHRPLQCGRR